MDSSYAKFKSSIENKKVIYVQEFIKCGCGGTYSDKHKFFHSKTKEHQ